MLNFNRRFSGSVIARVGQREFTLLAADFSLEEAGTRSLGDGDIQYEELWIAHAEPGEDGDVPFDAVHVNVVRFNEESYAFYGAPEVIYPTRHPVQVDDNLELLDSDEQGASVDDSVKEPTLVAGR